MSLRVAIVLLSLVDAVADTSVLDLRFRSRDGVAGPARGVLLARTGDVVRRLILNEGDHR